jgi:putative transposase
MPDHLHILLSPAESIEKAAQLVKGGFSFAVRKHYAGEVWQPGYFAHRITDVEDYAAQIRYIANNPLHKGYADTRPGPGYSTTFLRRLGKGRVPGPKGPHLW